MSPKLKWNNNKKFINAILYSCDDIFGLMLWKFFIKWEMTTCFVILHLIFALVLEPRKL